MNKIEKYQTLIIFLAIPVGLLFGQILIVEQYAENFIIPFLFAMLFGVFLNIPLKDYRKAFVNVKFSSTVVLINFLWTPILAWLLANFFFSSCPILQIGFIILMVTPCIDWYLIFTDKAKGNVPLAASVLPANLILQVVLLPVYLLIFAGVPGTVDMHEVFVGVAIILVLPFVLAQLGQFLLNKIQNKDSSKKIFEMSGPLQTIFLAMAIAAMFASKGDSLLANLNIIAMLLIPIVLFYIITFALSQLMGKSFKYSYGDTASLTLTTTAKNSPMMLGVVLLVFPDEPLIHLIMVVAPLIELPAMMLITKMLLMIRRRQKINNINDYRT